MKKYLMFMICLVFAVFVDSCVNRNSKGSGSGAGRQGQVQGRSTEATTTSPEGVPGGMSPDASGGSGGGGAITHESTKLFTLNVGEPCEIKDVTIIDDGSAITVVFEINGTTSSITFQVCANKEAVNKGSFVKICQLFDGNKPYDLSGAAFSYSNSIRIGFAAGEISTEKNFFNSNARSRVQLYNEARSNGYSFTAVLLSKDRDGEWSRSTDLRSWWEHGLQSVKIQKSKDWKFDFEGIVTVVK